MLPALHHALLKPPSVLPWSPLPLPPDPGQQHWLFWLLLLLFSRIGKAGDKFSPVIKLPAELL